jgi:hypothetical protein
VSKARATAVLIATSVGTVARFVSTALRGLVVATREQLGRWGPRRMSWGGRDETRRRYVFGGLSRQAFDVAIRKRRRR